MYNFLGKLLECLFGLEKYWDGSGRNFGKDKKYNCKWIGQQLIWILANYVEVKLYDALSSANEIFIKKTQDKKFKILITLIKKKQLHKWTLISFASKKKFIS